MREIEYVPSEWMELGVWYCVDVDDNQRTYRRWQTLATKAASTKLEANERKELKQLEAEVPNLLWALIQPYSAEDYQQSRSDNLSRLTIQIDEDTQQGTVKTDTELDEHKWRQSVVRLRSPEIKGYRAWRMVEGVRTACEPNTGAKLVELIMGGGPPSERKVIVDIFNAITSSSHLEAGRKKGFDWLPSCLPPVTLPSDGAAALAEDQATSTT